MSMKWLLPVDGSEAALHAVRAAIEEAKQCGTPPALLLLNVQGPLSRDITRFVNGDTLKEFHEENGTAAMAEAKKLLDASALPYSSKIVIGETAQAIADAAAADTCTRIVMGARGMGSVMGMLMGSVTTKVIHLSPVPVLLVK